MREGASGGETQGEHVPLPRNHALSHGTGKRGGCGLPLGTPFWLRGSPKLLEIYFSGTFCAQETTP